MRVTISNEKESLELRSEGSLYKALQQQQNRCLSILLDFIQVYLLL